MAACESPVTDLSSVTVDGKTYMMSTTYNPSSFGAAQRPQVIVLVDGAPVDCSGSPSLCQERVRQFLATQKEIRRSDAGTTRVITTDTSNTPPPPFENGD